MRLEFVQCKHCKETGLCRARRRHVTRSFSMFGSNRRPRERSEPIFCWRANLVWSDWLAKSSETDKSNGAEGPTPGPAQCLACLNRSFVAFSCVCRCVYWLGDEETVCQTVSGGKKQHQRHPTNLPQLAPDDRVCCNDSARSN